MPLFKTTPGGADEHWHLFYVNPETGEALTSADADDGHRHMAVPGAQPLQLLPWVDAEGVEHSHMLSPDAVGVKPKPETTQRSEKKDAETMLEVLDLFRTAQECESESIAEMKTANEYVKGEQWSEVDRAKLESEGRPALTMNVIAPTLDVLSGVARQNRVDWRWFPVEGSDNSMADLYNMISKHLAKRSNVETEEIDVFEEECKGRSFFEVAPDFSKNPLGEVRISHFPSPNVRLLRHLKKDLSDCEGVFKFQDLSVADAKTRYPAMKKKFDALFLDNASSPKTPPPEEAVDLKLIESPDGYGATTDTAFIDPTLYTDTVVDIGRKTVRLLEFERREYRTAHLVILPIESAVVEVSAKEVAMAETLDPMLKTFDTQQARIRVIVSVGPYVVKDGYPARPFKDEYSLVPVYAKKDGDEYWGKVRDVIDAQDEINKRRSQVMDILNKMAAYGWFYDSETFDTPEEARRFDNNVATPGFRLKIKSIQAPPLKVEGTKFPAEIFQMEQASIQMFHLISNVNVQMLGQAKAAESGFSKQIQMKQAMLGNEYLFDNFILAKRKVGRLAMGWAKMIYSPQRIARIVVAGAGSQKTEGETLKIGGQPLPEQMNDQEKEYWMREIAKMWSTGNIMDYDVEVGEGQLSPTARSAAFTQWLEAKKTGVDVPPELILLYSDLPEHQKRKFMELMKAQQERAMALEERKTEVELQKARGGAPPLAPPVQTGQPQGPQGPTPQMPQMPPGQVPGFPR